MVKKSEENEYITLAEENLMKPKHVKKVDPAAWDAIVQRMKDRERNKNTMDKNVENVVSQLQEREQRGLSKYGVNTERTDLSTLEWLQHLQEELMDATVYIEKLKNDLKD